MPGIKGTLSWIFIKNQCSHCSILMFISKRFCGLASRHHKAGSTVKTSYSWQYCQNNIQLAVLSRHHTAGCTVKTTYRWLYCHNNIQLAVLSRLHTAGTTAKTNLKIAFSAANIKICCTSGSGSGIGCTVF